MTRTLGRWRLEKRLGRGGMGEVWRARGDDGAAVVVKRLHPYLVEDAGFRRMFAIEARVAATLAHPNVARFVELGEAGGELFLVIEHVAGVDLRALLGAHGRALPVGAALHIARDVARALAHAHGHGVIHRDVTPTNVMVGDDGVVRLIDFGIAKATEELADAETRTGVLKGKVGYLAPEQLRAGETIDARVDVWACGVILHEMLCGRRLFKAESEARTIDLVLAGGVRAPSTVNPAVPAAVDAIVMAALAATREARTASAAALAEALVEARAASGWDEAETGALAAAMRPAEETTTTTEAPLPEPAPRTVTEARAPRPARRARTIALAVAGVLAVVGAALLVAHRARRNERPPPPQLVVRPVVAAPPVTPLPVAPPPVAPPPVTPVTAAAPPVAAPAHERHKHARHRAADIERGDVVDPFHRR